MKTNGIYYKILLVIIISGAFFLLLLSILYFINNEQEALMVKDSQRQFNNEINSLVTLKTETLKQVVYDYTFWNDFVENIKKSDTAWFNNNITTILKSYHIDHVCVYDTNFEIIHKASSDEFNSNDFISREVLIKLRDKRFLNYFQITDDGVVEISCASVHPETDPTHLLTKPFGYLILAKSWNQSFIDGLTILSGAKINLYKHSDSIPHNNRYDVFSVQKLADWNNENIAQIKFTRTSNSLKLYHRMSVFMMVILLGSIITTWFVFHITTRKWVNKPLHLVTSILKSGNLNQIKELQQCGGEFMDIGLLFSDSIKQKEELRLAKEHAEESERKFMNILDNSPFHIWEFDGTRYNYMNKAYFTFTGLEKTEILSIDKWTEYVHPDDLKEAWKIWENAWEGKKAHDSLFRLKNKAGIYRDFWCHSVPIFDEAGNFTVFQGYNLDITDRNQAEKEILKLNAELDQRVKQRTAELEAVNKELETFSYSVSHDLKAPLRHISGFIGLFLENKTTELTNEELGYLEKISGSVIVMAHLIDAILSFSRLNLTELRKTSIHTSIMVQHVIKFFEPEMQNRKITFNVESLPEIQGDEELIQQVWTNLISNAIKYTGNKSEAVIDIGSMSTDKWTTFFVKDNGTGFNMKYSEKLFGVFQRLHKSRDFEGIGIGLANVNRIITRHGGFCRAEGEPDQGATFYFSIPD